MNLYSEISFTVMSKHCPLHGVSVQYTNLSQVYWLITMKNGTVFYWGLRVVLSCWKFGHSSVAISKSFLMSDVHSHQSIPSIPVIITTLISGALTRVGLGKSLTETHSICYVINLIIKSLFCWDKILVSIFTKHKYFCTLLSNKEVYSHSLYETYLSPIIKFYFFQVTNHPGIAYNTVYLFDHLFFFPGKMCQ